MKTETLTEPVVAAGTAEKQLTNPKSAKRTFQELVESADFKAQITMALPKHLTPDRFVRVLMTATIKNPLLLQCTQESMFKGIFDCAAAGLELDGRRAHLIPFKNNRKGVYEAQLILDYKGVAELVLRSGIVSTIHADIVCENDVFEYDRGAVSIHKIDLKQERGEMYAVYCLIRMKDGTEKAEVMSKRDVDRIRARSRSASDGPWVTDYAEMAKKTVFKRASKWVPLSSEVRGAIESEDESSDEPVNITPKPDVAGMIGAGPQDGDERPAIETSTAPLPEKPVLGDRQTVMDVLQSLMLDKGVSEANAVRVATENKWTPPKSRTLEDIDTVGLQLLRDHLSK